MSCVGIVIMRPCGSYLLLQLLVFLHSYFCMQQCWLENPDKRPHFRDMVTTISNMLESIAGYLDLKRSFSLIESIKKSHSPHPKRTEMPTQIEEREKEKEEEGEKLEGGEGAEEAVQWDPEKEEERKVQETAM